MEYLMAEEIAKLTQDLDGLANIRAINKLYREQDESHKWPICSRFNVTDRAIRRVRKHCQQAGPLYGLEYCYSLEAALSDIVNSNY